MIEFSFTEFADKDVNDLARRPLTPENWNAFAIALKSKVLHVPACYSWVREYSTEPDVFLSSFVTDVVWYVFDESLLLSWRISGKVLRLVSAMIVAKLPISFVFQQIYWLKDKSN